MRERHEASYEESVARYVDPFEVALTGTPPRFAAAARDVWRAVPPAVRADLRRRWRRDPSRRPLVMVIAGLVVDGCPVIGTYQQETGALFFDRAAVERLSDDGLRALVAHELVHCWRFDTVRSATDADEVDAEATAALWGFGWRAEYDAAFAAAAC